MSELDRVSRITLDHIEATASVRERIARIEQENENCKSGRTKLSEDIGALTAKVSRIELKLAWYAGALAVLVFLLGMAEFLLSAMHK